MEPLTEAQKVQVHLLYRRELIKMRELEETDHVVPLSDRLTGLNGQVFSTFLTPGRIQRSRSRANIKREDDSVLYLAWCQKVSELSFHFPRFVRIAFIDFFQTFEKLFRIIRFDQEKAKWLSIFERLMVEGQRVLDAIYLENEQLKKLMER